MLGRSLACCRWGLVSLLLTVSPALMAFSGGSGTPEDPYEIGTPAEWQELVNYSSYWNQHFKLVDNINLSGVWPVKVATKTVAFTGSLNGQDYTISNFSIDQNITQRVGLFAWIGPTGQIRNLKIQGASVTGYLYVGALAGWNDGSISNCSAAGTIRGGIVGGLVGYNSGLITECFATGTVAVAPNANNTMGGLAGTNSGTLSLCSASSSVTGNVDIGGLAGLNYGTVNQCVAEGTATGNSSVGGLVARNETGAAISESSAKTRVIGGSYTGGLVGQNTAQITKCFALGTVSGSDQVGGLVGRAYGNINNSYARGSVSGSSYVGGLAGWVGNSSPVVTLVDRCYSTGSASGTSYAYGLAGYLDQGFPAGTISNCLWDTTTSGQSGSYGGQGLPTSQMQTITPYQLWYNWDFTTVWAICEGTNYPRLRWQIPQADIVCPDGVHIADFSHLATWWNQADCGTENDCDGADLDTDGVVDINDFVIFASNWLVEM